MNLTDLKKVLLANNGKSTIYVQGPPGCGKSSVIQQVHDELDMNFFADVRLGTRDNAEVKGIQIPDVESRCTIATLPDYFPQDEDAHGIILLDEFDHATPATQSAAYQLILDRKIGNFKVPDNVWVMMASNSKIDGGVHFKVPRPIKNRVIQISAKADVTEWLDYALEANINTGITSFIRANSEYLYYENPTDANMNNSLGAFATPRSWFTSDGVLDNFNIEGMDEYIIEEVLIGTIGYSATKKFLNFLTTVESSLDLDEILKGKLSSIKSDDLGNINAMYYLLGELESRIVNQDGIALKTTNTGLLEFINMIDDKALKTVFWRSVQNRAKRVLEPLKKEVDESKLRMQILKAIN